MIPKFQGKFYKGHFYANNQMAYCAYMNSFPDGTPAECIIGKPKKKRSNNQNKYYWKSCIEIPSAEWGYFPEEVHEIFKNMFLKIPGIDGKPDRFRSTTDLSTLEFEEYCSSIRTWCSTNHNIYIPLPNEVEI